MEHSGGDASDGDANDGGDIPIVHWLYDFQLPWSQIDTLNNTVDGDDECDALMNVVAVKRNEPNKVAVFARWSNSQKAHQQFWATFSLLRCQFECWTTFYATLVHFLATLVALHFTPVSKSVGR